MRRFLHPTFKRKRCGTWPSTTVLNSSIYLRNEVLPAFEEEYGVEVSLEAVSSWDLRSERILLSIASGVPYDVVTTGFYSPYEEGALGYLAPLTEYVAGWEYAHEVPGPIWEAVSWQDNIYVMPYNMGPRAIAYNSPEEALMRAHELWTRLLAEWKAELAAEQ